MNTVRPKAEDVKTALHACALKHGIGEAELQAKAALDSELAAELQQLAMAAMIIRVMDSLFG